MKEMIAKFWPVFVITSTPFLAAALKKVIPEWEKRMGVNYVFVVAALASILNMLGYAISPEQMDSLSVVSSAIAGAGLGLGSSKMYDMNKGGK